ncbi:MAG TPA: hypothetical protein VG820_08105, partial [Fimbriimonadaceae bacterium]|nr:hypothetical protein [Fimbriimonadaceae bacterium]
KWAMNVEAMPKDLFDKPCASIQREKDPGYFDGRISLSEKLERFHLQTGLPVVATSFRTPALDQNSDDLDSAREGVQALVGREKCFVRCEDGFLLVRHPAYWLLRSSEPPEEIVAALEKVAEKRPLTICEYAGLAVAVGRHTDSGASFMNLPGFIPHSFDRLLNLRGLLLRFDGNPLATAYPALYFLGTLPAEDQARLLDGQVWNAHIAVVATTESDTVTSQKGYRMTKQGARGAYAGTFVIEHKDRRTYVVADTGWSYAADFLGTAGPIFDATTSLRYITPAERGYDLLAHSMNEPSDDVNASLDELLSRMSRGRLVWMQALGPRDYIFDVGFPGDVVAAYRVSIDWKPKPGG